MKSLTAVAFNDKYFAPSQVKVPVVNSNVNPVLDFCWLTTNGSPKITILVNTRRKGNSVAPADMNRSSHNGTARLNLQTGPNVDETSLRNTA